MKKIKHISIVLLLFCSLPLLAQTKKTKKADSYFNKMAYINAAKAYEKIAKKSPTPTKHVLQQLGDSYYYNVKMAKASSAYNRLFLFYAHEVSPEYMFKYAQALRGIKKYKESDKWIQKFNEAKKEDRRGENFIRNKEKITLLKEDPKFSISNLKNINSSLSDFGTTFYKNGILFASSKRENRQVKRIYAWNKQPFLDIYYAPVDTSNQVGNIVKFPKKINSKYHESSVSFSPDKQVMYFTRNNYNNGKYREDKKGINKLKIYRAERDSVNNTWKNIKELPFNSNEYSVGHPSVSKDGKKLYFTSDMPGTIGQTDIFYVEIKGYNSYGNPVNLGKNINTEGREMFPYISDDNTLYFSSDGRFGLGALDIFSSKLETTGFEKAINLKAPVNSELDDFAFIINPTTRKGYVSSNRKGGLGDDDIYSVTQLEEIIIPPCFTEKQGVVVDKITQQILPGAKVILSKNNIKLDSTIVGADARFRFKVSCDSTYVVKATKEYYLPSKQIFVAKKATEKEDIKLQLILHNDFTHCEEGAICIKINPIYFNYNKSDIRPDAAEELNHIVSIMRKYPKIIIQSGSHTDARGRARYNEKLSDRRAKSTVRYIISQGISPERISGKGFGETRLTNGCVDNDRHTNRVKCSAEEHQANRRTEFVIVDY